MTKQAHFKFIATEHFKKAGLMTGIGSLLRKGSGNIMRNIGRSSKAISSGTPGSLKTLAKGTGKRLGAMGRQTSRVLKSNYAKSSIPKHLGRAANAFGVAAGSASLLGKKEEPAGYAGQKPVT